MKVRETTETIMPMGWHYRGKRTKDDLCVCLFVTLNKARGYQYYSLRKIYEENKLRYLRGKWMVLPLICCVGDDINN